MKIITLNEKQGYAKLKMENPDDLWYLSHIVDPGDFVKGKTLRKIQKGTEEKSKQVKRPVTLKIKAEKIEFSKTSNVLRIGGGVVEGPDDIAHGSWHTFNIDDATEIGIEKEKWLSFQKEKLDEAVKATGSQVLICVFDRESAYFAIMKKYGFEMLSQLKGNVSKKGIDEKIKGDFYSEIIKQLKDYVERYNAEKIILGSPAFWKDEFMKSLKDTTLKKKIITATCSSVNKNGINEIIKRPEAKEALKEERASEEMHLVEEILSEISKDGLFAYGIRDTEKAAMVGAIRTLLVLDTVIMKMRDEGKYERLDTMMKLVDSSKGKIKIISADHDGGKKLKGITGIAALLRYKI